MKVCHTRYVRRLVWIEFEWCEPERCMHAYSKYANLCRTGYVFYKLQIKVIRGNSERTYKFFAVTRVLRTHTRCAVIVCAVSY